MIWPAMLRSRCGVIGLDIGSRSVKAAQMAGGELIAAIQVPRMNAGGGALADAEARQVCEMLRRRPFRGRRVATAVPSHQLMTGILELPPRSSGAPIEHLARVELGRRYDAEPSQFEADCWDLPSPVRAANRTCVMAVACKRQDAHRLLDDLEPHGLSVTALDVHALALARACRPLLAESGGTGAIMDVGWAASRLVLVHHGTVVYERALPRLGVSAMAALMAAQVGVETVKGEELLASEGLAGRPGQADNDGAVTLQDEETPDVTEAMAAEVRTPLSYLSSQYSDATVRQVVLVGGGALTPGLAARLSERLGLAVVSPGLESLCECDPELSAMGPAMAVAIGLARYGEDDE
ncbi:MAG: hypothetical protein BIFFINMI_02786 [Phycisphaerae bacterium]|nr:hypothetical protein [Phycisphaerae bacterium]